MDRNGNGMIDMDEMEGPARFMIERMARSNPSIDMSRPIPLSVLTSSMQQSLGGPSSSSSIDDSSIGPTTLVPGFGIKQNKPPVPGFGANGNLSSVPVEEQDLREAEERIQRYDRNRDSMLDEEELRSGRWSDSPMQYDRNGDGKLSRDELAVRYARRRLEGDGGSSSTPTPSNQLPSTRSFSRMGGGPEGRPQEEEPYYPFENTASYRLGESSGGAKRPAGLPEWFVRLDRNGDNQVAMAEFISSPSSQAIEDYARFDTNMDGFITAPEALAAVKNGYIPNSSSGSSSARSESPREERTDRSRDFRPASPGPEAASSRPSSSPQGTGQSDDRMKTWIAGRVARSDTNKNGKLEIDEYKNYNPKGDFAKADRNKDGTLDLDELVAEREANR